MGKHLTVGMIQYSENEDACHGCLSMLNSQIDVNFGNFEFIIVNDHSNVILSEKYLKSFKNLKIKYIKRKENGGPGMARQEVIDHATGDWITFIDIDDVFQNCCVLSYFETAIYPNTSQLDIVHNAWFTSFKMEGTDYYQYQATPPNNLTWMFAKFWRRGFLKENKIRHHPELRVHEDSYFIRIANACEPRQQMNENFAVYIWRQAEDSITRKENQSYAYTSYATYIRAVDLVCDFMKTRNKKMIPETVLQQLMYSYISLQNPEWWDGRAKGEGTEDNFDWFDYTMDYVSYFYHKWKSEIAQYGPNERNMMFMGIASQFHGVPHQSFDEWMKDVEDREVKTLPKLKGPDTTTLKKNGDLDLSS